MANRWRTGGRTIGPEDLEITEESILVSRVTRDRRGRWWVQAQIHFHVKMPDGIVLGADGRGKMKAHYIVEQTLRAAEMFPVRDFVQEELDCRKWSRGDLAERMGCVVAVVNSMLDDPEYSLTPDICQQLGTAFGVSPQFWFNLDLSYWLWKLSGKGRKP